jgi:hypothetical protein
MSNTPTPSLLNRTGSEVVKDLFFQSFSRALQVKFLDFTVDAPQSQLVITSLDESQDGEVGIYRNVYRWSYLKADLTAMFPYSLAVQAQYPVTFRQLQSLLLNRYNLLLEPNEFCLSPNAVPLVEDDLINSTLLNNYSQMKLYAHAQSARFVENSELSLIFIQPDRRIPLRALFDLKTPNVLDVMALI